MSAGVVVGRHLESAVDDHVLKVGHLDRKRIFNLGYYTWVEQHGIAVQNFDRRKD